MDAAAGKITEQVMGILFKFIGRHIGYVVSYKKHIRSLEDEAERLEEVKLRIRGMVDEARSNAEVIDRGVERWLEEVQQKQDEVVELLEGKEKVSCLSVGSCYRLGRRGCQKKEDVIGLKQRGDGFVEGGSVGRPARLTDIWYTHASDYQHFDSRDFIFKEIMDALQDDSKYLIGIHGMPGVGKTRLADEVAKQAKEDKLFEEIAKATVSQTLDWEAIQRELAECLNLQLRKESRAGRAGELRNRLKNGEKILLILDDVWSQINLKEIGIPFNDQTKGCKILLTSRRQDVCIQMGVEKVFRLGVLREDEAWSLLKKKVGDSIDTPEMQLLAKEVCKECGGLPLAILAVGGALMGADKHAWKDALYQLRNSRGNDIDGIEAEVYTPIELSYKYLKRADAQSCFLHCSLFREDAEISIDDLLRYGVGTRFLESINKMEEARDRVHALVGTLKRSSLLLQGRNENFVKMHDIIRDVAISIASKDEQYAFLVKNGVQRWLDNEKYECCMAISLRSNAICELPDKLKCPKLRTLVLVHEMERYGDPLLKVPNNFFKWMEKLEVLHLTRLHISTLTSSLRNLINLRMLCLNSCKLVSASLINELDKLEILSLENCDIDESPNLRTDFDFVEPAIEAVKFIHLRILDFNSNRGLRLPSGSISNLPLLEELYIYHFDGWEVEGSVSLLELNYLAGLSSLAIHLQDVMLLPKDLHFNSLNRFKISIGSRIDYSDYGYNSSIARALKLKGIPLKVGFNVLMERVQALSFIEINGLEKVLLNTDFPDLEYLKVDRCSGTEHLLGKAKSNSQTVSASLDKLRVLKVSNCTMKYLFFGSNAKGIQQLQQLHVQNCDRMEAITGERDTERAMDTIIFNQLKDLKLKYLPKLKSVCANMRQMSNTEFNTSTGTTLTLFNEKISFPALEELNIKRLDNITVILAKQLSRIWTEASQAQPCSFNKLRALTVSENCKLKYLFSPSIARFLQNQLQQLKIKGCDSIEAIIGNDEEEVTDNITFHQLKDLKLLNLPSLRSIYAVNTEEISSIECNPSTIAPPLVNAKSFPALETLTIEKLDSIPVIFEKQLLLIGMEESHAELCSFSKLSDLTVNGNCKLKYLFSPCIATWLPQLKQLHVEDCENMEALIGIGEDEEEIVGDIIFCQLKRLMLVDLPNLKSISANTRKVTSPTTALSLFNAKVWFPSLETLVINGLDMIIAICEMQLAPNQTGTSQDLLYSFKKLSYLTVSWNCKLKYLFSHSMARCLGQLHTLNVEHCRSMEAIIGDDKVEVMDNIIFYELKNLKLEYLPNLKSIFANTRMSSTTCNPSTTATTFFNAKVSFPILEVLSINSLDSIRRFGAIISSQQLQELTIISCEKIEELIAIESRDKGEEVIDDEILTFTQLRKIKLDKLPNLERLFFCYDLENKGKNKMEDHHSHGLFSNKVSFSALESLFIKEIDYIARLELLISFQKVDGDTVAMDEDSENESDDEVDGNDDGGDHEGDREYDNDNHDSVPHDDSPSTLVMFTQILEEMSTISASIREMRAEFGSMNERLSSMEADIASIKCSHYG